MTAEIVVILQDEHARLSAGGLMKEPRGGEPADASSDDDQIIGFARVDGIARVRPETAVAQAMRNFEGSLVTTAQSVKRRRIVAGLFCASFIGADTSWANRCAPRLNAAAPIAIAAPFMKSRRVILRSMPSSLSVKVIGLPYSMQKMLSGQLTRAYRALHKALPFAEVLTREEHFAVRLLKQWANTKPLARPIDRVGAMYPGIVLPGLIESVDERIGGIG